VILKMSEKKEEVGKDTQTTKAAVVGLIVMLIVLGGFYVGINRLVESQSSQLSQQFIDSLLELDKLDVILQALDDPTVVEKINGILEKLDAFQQLDLILTELNELGKLDIILSELGVMQNGGSIDATKLDAILVDLGILNDIDLDLDGLTKLNTIIAMLTDVLANQNQMLTELSGILDFVENQDAFNTQLIDVITTMNTTCINNTYVYEIRNETLVEVTNTMIDNGTYVYDIESLDIEDLDIDVDIDVELYFVRDGCRWYIRCQPQIEEVNE